MARLEWAPGQLWVSGSDRGAKAGSLGDFGLRLSSPGNPILPYLPLPLLVKMGRKERCLEDQRPETNHHQHSHSWVSFNLSASVF